MVQEKYEVQLSSQEKGRRDRAGGHPAPQGGGRGLDRRPGSRRLDTVRIRRRYAEEGLAIYRKLDDRLIALARADHWTLRALAGKTVMESLSHDQKKALKPGARSNGASRRAPISWPTCSWPTSLR